MNETIVVENGQAAVATTSVSGTLSPASSATDTIAIVDTPAGKQAALKVYNLNGGGGGGGGGEVSGDFLPLSGGTMTGPIVIDSSMHSSTFLQATRSYLALTSLGQIYFGGAIGFNGDLESFSSSNNIGSSSTGFGTAYLRRLNNGADIAIPTEGGTMARVEDIDAIVGDISTALTAILGE